MQKPCDHLRASDNAPARTVGCEECMQSGDTWVHLRRCLRCGHIGCCDASKNKHAAKHHETTKHPTIQSFETGETWKWCYLDSVTIN